MRGETGGKTGQTHSKAEHSARSRQNVRVLSIIIKLHFPKI